MVVSLPLLLPAVEYEPPEYEAPGPLTMESNGAPAKIYAIAPRTTYWIMEARENEGQGVDDEGGEREGGECIAIRYAAEE